MSRRRERGRRKQSVGWIGQRAYEEVRDAVYEEGDYKCRPCVADQDSFKACPPGYRPGQKPRWPECAQHYNGRYHCSVGWDVRGDRGETPGSKDVAEMIGLYQARLRMAGMDVRIDGALGPATWDGVINPINDDARWATEELSENLLIPGWSPGGRPYSAEAEETGRCGRTGLGERGIEECAGGANRLPNGRCPQPAPEPGGPCTFNDGREGQCLPISACEGGYRQAGHCPGGANIQCCTAEILHYDFRRDDDDLLVDPVDPPVDGGESCPPGTVATAPNAWGDRGCCPPGQNLNPSPTGPRCIPPPRNGNGNGGKGGGGILLIALAAIAILASQK